MNGGTARRAALVLAWGTVMALSGWFAFVRTPLVTELARFVSSDDPIATLLNELGGSLGGRVLFVGIEGGDEPARAAASLRLAEALRADPLFARVANGAEAVRPEAVRVLFENRYLLSPRVSAATFGEEALREALKERLRELASPIALLEGSLLTSDPTGEMRALQTLWQGGVTLPAKRRGVWVSADGRRALALVETVAAGSDPEAQQRATDAIRAAFAALPEARDLRLVLGGLGVFTSSAQTAIREDMQDLALIGGLAIAVFLLAVYRSPRLVLLGAIPLASAVMLGGAAAALAFGALYGIAVGCGVTLLGVVDDYPIHLFSHLNGEEAPAETLARLWPTLRLCVVTTAIGYLFMATTSFAGLRQLALYSIVGLFAAAATTRWLLPALLPARWRWRHPPAAGPWLDRLLRPRLPRPTLVGVAVLLAVTAGLALAPPRWEGDVAALSPVPRSLLALDRELRRDLGAPEPGHVVVLRARSAEDALQGSERVAAVLDRVKEEGLITGFLAPSLYLPSAASQRARQASLPDPDRLRASLVRASQGLPIRPEAFAPFLAAVAKARQTPPLDPAAVQASALGPRLSSLLVATDAGWLAVLPLVGVADPPRLAQALAQLPVDEALYVNIRAETSRLLAELRDEALSALAWGALVYLAVLAVGVRSLKRVVAVVVPVALALALDLALLTLAGERLSLFHLISLLLVLGFGLDFSLFFSEPATDRQESRRTLHAILVGCASTSGVFAILSWSSVAALNVIGKTVALGVILSFLTALLLARRGDLPALAPGAGGGDRERRAAPPGRAQ